MTYGILESFFLFHCPNSQNLGLGYATDRAHLHETAYPNSVCDLRDVGSENIPFVSTLRHQQEACCRDRTKWTPP